jgi:hypothetical protein
MPEVDTDTREDRARVLKNLVAGDPTFKGYRVVEVFESESGNKLTLVLVKKEVTGRSTLVTGPTVT